MNWEEYFSVDLLNMNFKYYFIRALNEKKIAGAGLDVTATETLPKDSPLWDMDNVILSPHIAGGMKFV